ncbi:hypothetical protein FACS18945_3690 [Bacteroidia bacterium]|nr:hypothetical protein FACS18945_3690 [Bacteroidia bacterium]
MYDQSKPDFRQYVASAMAYADSHVLDLLQRIYPDGYMNRNEFEVSSINGNTGERRGASFKYNIKKNIWTDFNGSSKGGKGIWSLIKRAKKFETSYEQAKWVLEGKPVLIDYEIKSRQTKQKEYSVTQLAPIPAWAKLWSENPGELRTIHKYHNEAGQEVMYNIRTDYSDGRKKQFCILHWDENLRRFRGGTLEQGRPLYNLHLLKYFDKIMITEGENTVEAARDYYPEYGHTTWFGGCNAIEKTDWTPLAGKSICIVADADFKMYTDGPNKGMLKSWDEQPGWIAAKKIATTLTALGCNVQIVNTYEMSFVKDGWDIKDAKDAKINRATLTTFIRKNIFNYR